MTVANVSRIIRTIFTMIAIGMFLYAPGNANATQSSITWVPTLSAAKTAAASSGKLIMVDVFATWCGYCTLLDDNTFPDPGVISASNQFVCVQLDDSNGSSIDSQYGITGFPTMLFLKPDGTLFTQIVGYEDAGYFASQLNSIESDYTSTLVPAITSMTPSSGSPGTTVTITGSSLVGAKGVSFHGTSATFTVVDAATITAVVPQGATTGTVTVTTPSTTVTSPQVFTVTPGPTITSFSPKSGSVGDTVSITGTDLTAVTLVEFNGTSATFTVLGDTLITAIVPAGATTGPVAVCTTSAVCVSGGNFTVTAPFVPAPTISPSSGTVTPGQPVLITDTYPGASIYYTMNGTAPTTNSTLYTGPIILAGSATIEAIAAAPGLPLSDVAAQTYVVAYPTPPPHISPNGGTYLIGQSITITDPDPTAVIYYTTNGSLPTAASAVYSGPMTLNSSQTITAIAIAPGFASSPTVSSTFETVVHTFAPGLQLMSVPYDYSATGMPPSELLAGLEGSKLAVWVPGLGQYKTTPDYPADQLRPGQAYWVRFTGHVVLEVAGSIANPANTCSVSLSAGWNMIGSPRTSPVALSSLTVVDSNNVPHSFAAAASAGLVGGAMYAFQPGDTTYEVADVASGSMLPYYGYWFYSATPSTLVFPVVAP